MYKSDVTKGKKLKDLRELVNLNVDDVEEITGIPSMTILLYEEGMFGALHDDSEKLDTFYTALYDSSDSDFDSIMGLIKLACSGMTHIRTMFETIDDLSSAEKKAEERDDLESVKSLKNLRQQVIGRIRKKADSLELFLNRICYPEEFMDYNEEETSNEDE